MIGSETLLILVAGGSMQYGLSSARSLERTEGTRDRLAVVLAVVLAPL